MPLPLDKLIGGGSMKDKIRKLFKKKEGVEISREENDKILIDEQMKLKREYEKLKVTYFGLKSEASDKTLR